MSMATTITQTRREFARRAQCIRRQVAESRPAPRAAHRRDVQAEFVRELVASPGMRVQARPVVLVRA